MFVISGSLLSSHSVSQPYLVLAKSDGHAMMKLSTFHSFQTLSHAVSGCHKIVNKVTCAVSQETSREGKG